jgi:hypothetical protein
MSIDYESSMVSEDWVMLQTAPCNPFPERNARDIGRVVARRPYGWVPKKSKTSAKKTAKKNPKQDDLDLGSANYSSNAIRAIDSIATLADSNEKLITMLKTIHLQLGRVLKESGCDVS